MEIIKLLEAAVRSNASDLHLTAGLSPLVRVYGELAPLKEPPLGEADLQAIAAQILDGTRKARFEEEGEVDFSFHCPEAGRFRMNVYRQRGAPGIACRVIRSEIPALSSLCLPETAAALARRKRGLLLVTGAAGSGKSTTLAALIDLLNQERACHIITLEDPIEHLHRPKRSMITQREIGSDSRSFPSALRAALRQDPDVILVGEMRDLETISIAVTAAETGHLVLATLHTVDAPQAVERIIDVFPPYQQQQIRVQLANTLLGVIAQRLLPRRDLPGLVAAAEVLVNTPAVRNLIREGKIYQLYSVMQTGGGQGMQTMEAALRSLCERGLIREEDAAG